MCRCTWPGSNGKQTRSASDGISSLASSDAGHITRLEGYAGSRLCAIIDYVVSFRNTVGTRDELPEIDDGSIYKNGFRGIGREENLFDFFPSLRWKI